MEQTNLPLISVIVPVYNVEKYLPACVNSIIGQTYKNIEILLIDDGSTDASGELCDDFCIKDRRCKAIHQENQGLSGARNTGLRVVTGEYISFIDGDDYIHPQFYEVLYNAISEGDYDFSMVGTRNVDEGGVNNGVKYIERPYKTHVLSRDELMEELFKTTQSYGEIAIMCNKLYKREIIGSSKFCHIVSEDNEYNTRIFLNTSSAIFVGNAELYYYVQRTSSIMHQPFGQRNVDVISDCFLSCLNDIPKNQYAYRGFCLERLYKTILATRYNSPENYKEKVTQTIKKAAKSTMAEYVQNRHIPLMVKTSTLLFYYCPAAYSSYIWLMQNSFLYKLYTMFKKCNKHIC